MADYLLAHDLGTTGNKATLFDDEGRLLHSAFAPYTTDYPQPGWAEQEPEDWWNAICAASREILTARPEASARLAAVSFSAMMNGCLLVNDAGNPLHRAMIHADTRSTERCSAIAERIGDERAYLLTGNRLAPYFTLSKLAWLAHHQPQLVTSARWCVQTKDYLQGRLTGNWGLTDRSDASLTGCFDMERGEWSHEMTDAAGIDARLLPTVLASTTVIGRVTPQAAEETGLPAGLPVVLGGGDGACATAGAGAVQHGDAYHYLGGTSWIAAVTDGYRPDPTRRLSVFCTLDPQKNVLYGTVQSAGTSLDWFRSALGSDSEEDHTAAFEQVERAAGRAPVGSRDLFYLPYLAGERSPIWDAKARGVYFGLTAAHRRPELARAVFEGVAYALNSNLTALRDLSLAPEALRVLGGGMRSPLWRSILANVYGAPLLLLDRLSEATACGAAMAAAVAIGMQPDIATAARTFAPVSATVFPDAATTAVYARGFAFFQTLYPALADRFAALAAL